MKKKLTKKEKLSVSGGIRNLLDILDDRDLSGVVPDELPRGLMSENLCNEGSLEKCHCNNYRYSARCNRCH